MPNSELQRTRTNDPHGVRRKILDAAADLFQNLGYNTTTINDIARASGVTSGALHHHFPTKKAIGLATLRERVGPEVESVWLAPLQRARSTAAGITTVFRDIEKGLEERRAVQGCPLNNLALELSLADPDFRREIEAQFSHWRLVVAAKLHADRRGAGTKSGGRGEDPDTLATFIVAAYSGAMAMAKAEQNTRALKACRQELVRRLAPSLAI